FLLIPLYNHPLILNNKDFLHYQIHLLLNLLQSSFLQIIHYLNLILFIDFLILLFYLQLFLLLYLFLRFIEFLTLLFLILFLNVLIFILRFLQFKFLQGLKLHFQFSKFLLYYFILHLRKYLPYKHLSFLCLYLNFLIILLDLYFNNQNSIQINQSHQSNK
ncbi:hypothetical protein IMG5_053480, partial [Ichthyophthirius multifiliis]